MTWLDFIALILATGTPINAWLYEESIVAGWREWIHAWGDNDLEILSRRDKIRMRVAELLTCRFCLSHWLPLILLVVFFLPSLFISAPWNTIIKFPVYSLAATRGALCLGILMRRCRLAPPEFEDQGDNQE